MKQVQKILLLSIIILTLFLGIGNSSVTYADNFQEFKVKIITETKLYENPKIDSVVIINEIKFGEELTVIGEEIIDNFSSFIFYPVRYEKEGEEYTGYIIKNFVIKLENVPLGKRLDPNAKVIQTAQVYYDKNEGSKLQIKGEYVFLEEYQAVKVIDATDSKYKRIMFEIEGEIYTGFIKSEDILIEGFNATIILIVFIFFLASSMALSIFLTTRKKRKKKNKNK